VNTVSGGDEGTFYPIVVRMEARRSRNCVNATFPNICFVSNAVAYRFLSPARWTLSAQEPSNSNELVGLQASGIEMVRRNAKGMASVAARGARNKQVVLLQDEPSRALCEFLPRRIQELVPQQEADDCGATSRPDGRRQFRGLWRGVTIEHVGAGCANCRLNAVGTGASPADTGKSVRAACSMASISSDSQGLPAAVPRSV